MGKASIVLIAVMALAGCVTRGGSFCDVGSPIRLTKEQIAQLSPEQVRQYLAFNRKGEKLCNWRA